MVILIALAKTFGLVGIVVAPPLSAAVQILWSYLFIHRMASGSASKFSDLQERHSLLRTAIQASSEIVFAYSVQQHGAADPFVGRCWPLFTR
jgi:hypothetical protein